MKYVLIILQKFGGATTVHLETIPLVLLTLGLFAIGVPFLVPVLEKDLVTRCILALPGKRAELGTAAFTAGLLERLEYGITAANSDLLGVLQRLQPQGYLDFVLPPLDDRPGSTSPIYFIGASHSLTRREAYALASTLIQEHQDGALRGRDDVLDLYVRTARPKSRF